MPYNLEPAFVSLPAYRPIAFELYTPQSPTMPIVNAVVDIYQDGTKVVEGIIYKVSRVETTGFPTINNYFFEIDIQTYVQNLLGPDEDLTSTFPYPTTTGAVLNSEMYGAFYISVTYQLLNTSTGLLEDAPASADVSNEYYIYSNSRLSTAPLFEQMDLEDYIGSFFGAETKFLTKSARTLKICSGKSSFLSFIQPNTMSGISGYEVNLYDSSGSLLSTGQSEIVAEPYSAMQTMNTSVDSLAAQSYVAGPPNFADASLSYYEISFGYLVDNGDGTYSYFRQTEVFTYEIENVCCDSKTITLHWMNLLGGTDSYTFTEGKSLGIETSSNTARSALPWDIGSGEPNDPSDAGSFKINSQAAPFYLLSSRILSNAQAQWLSELLASIKVYAEIDGLFIPVKVQDITQPINRNVGKIRYEIIARLSNEWIIPRI